MKHIHIKIDDELKKSVQMKALEKNTNLTDLITDLLKKWLKSK